MRMGNWNFEDDGTGERHLFANVQISVHRVLSVSTADANLRAIFRSLVRRTPTSVQRLIIRQFHYFPIFNSGHRTHIRSWKSQTGIAMVARVCVVIARADINQSGRLVLRMNGFSMPNK
jgi:hypothetical protein